MLYRTCTMISDKDLARYGVFRAKDLDIVVQGNFGPNVSSVWQWLMTIKPIHETHRRTKV